MSIIRTGVLIGVVAAIALLPGRSAGPEHPLQDVEIFYGVVSAIDGVGLGERDSRLSLSVKAPAGTNNARVYRLYIDCDDTGFHSRMNGRPSARGWDWVSFGGSAGPQFAPIVHCPEADPSRYNRVVEIMGVGGDLQIARSEAVLKSRLGEARFSERPRPVD